MAVHNNFSSAFKSLNRKVGSVKNSLPSVLANLGTNLFLENFDNEKFNDGQKWKEPQRRIPGTNAYKYPKSKGLSRRVKRTLVGTGKLRREVNNSVKEKGARRIVWSVGLPYAAAHNEGLGHMPQRRYMGDSRILRLKFRSKITGAFKKTFS